MEIIAFHYKGLYSVLFHASASFKETVRQPLRPLIFLPNEPKCYTCKLVQNKKL